MKVLITGANRGIGLELTRQYLARGATVHAVCRATSTSLDESGAHVIAGIDITQDSAMADLADHLQGIELDIVINNAGILSDESLHDLDFDRMRRQFEVNTLGPLRVTAALRPFLKRGSKVLIITSRMGSIDDNTSGGRYGYRMSKAAVNMAGRSLAHDLQADGVAVALLHPGFVRTEMTGHQGLIDPDESARGLIARIDGLSLTNTGSFWHCNGEKLPW